MVEFPDLWRIIRAHWDEYGGDRMIPWDQCHFE
jgi:hypothetical protein